MMCNFDEIYLRAVSDPDFTGKVCPIMSGIGPMCSGSMWVGVTCFEGKCKAWDGMDCRLMKGCGGHGGAEGK